jgi:peroxiredoxin
MRGYWNRRWIVAVLLAAATAAAHAAAPDIALPDLDGRARNVNEFVGRGQWAVVVLWAHDCSVCAREIHEVADFHRAHAADGVRVLGVSIDGRAQRKQAQAFARTHKLPFVNLLAEPDREVLLAFGAGRFVGTPTYYIYNPSGEIVGENIGPVTRAELESFIASADNGADERQ